MEIPQFLPSSCCSLRSVVIVSAYCGEEGEGRGKYLKIEAGLLCLALWFWKDSGALWYCCECRSLSAFILQATERPI